MTYIEAIELIKNNPFNLGKISKDLIDIKLLRFTRRMHPGAGCWAIQGYGGNFKDKIEVWVDHVINFDDIPTQAT